MMFHVIPHPFLPESSLSLSPGISFGTPLGLWGSHLLSSLNLAHSNLGGAGCTQPSQLPVTAYVKGGHGAGPWDGRAARGTLHPAVATSPSPNADPDPDPNPSPIHTSRHAMHWHPTALEANPPQPYEWSEALRCAARCPLPFSLQRLFSLHASLGHPPGPCLHWYLHLLQAVPPAASVPTVLWCRFCVPRVKWRPGCGCAA